MRQQLTILLRFNIQASDGLVTGRGDLVTFIPGELPHKGDRIRLCTGDSEINAHSDSYMLTIVEICRNVGGDFTQPVLCEVTRSTWDPHSGKPPFYPSLTTKEIQDQWKWLQKRYEARTWRPDSQEGVKILTLDFDN